MQCSDAPRLIVRAVGRLSASRGTGLDLERLRLLALADAAARGRAADCDAAGWPFGLCAQAAHRIAERFLAEAADALPPASQEADPDPDPASGTEA